MMVRIAMLLLLAGWLAPFAATSALAQADDLEGVYDVQGVNPNGTTYTGEVTIQRQGSGYFFRWRIGNQGLQGTGTLRGNRLTINWGQQYPVIYTVGSDGVLRGTWSNGRATENLFPRAIRNPEGSSDLDGTYDVKGTNPNGGTYQGEVSIEYRAGSYYFRWTIGTGQTLEGRGTLRGNALTVNWGQQYPVIYVVGSDGVLHGTWDNGRATEVLYPRSAPPPEGSSALDGAYDVRGINPNGTRYVGEVTIRYEGRTYNFHWRIGSGQTFEGRGTLRGDVLTVNWGQQAPVIYTVGKDGVLRGTWSNGRASEDLYPRIIRAERPPPPSRPDDGAGGAPEETTSIAPVKPDDSMATTSKTLD